MPTRQSGSPRQQCIRTISAFLDSIDSQSKRSIDSSEPVQFIMIHIDPRTGLKSVNDPGIPGTFLVKCLAPGFRSDPLL